MPLHDWNDPATFASWYSIGAEGDSGHPSSRPELKLNYHRAVLLRVARHAAAEIIRAMGWTPPGPAIVLIDAGLCLEAEAFEELGFTRVVGISVSNWAHTVKTETEAAEIDAKITGLGLNPNTGEGAALRAKVFDGGVRHRASRGLLNEGLANQGSRNRVISALGGTVDAIVSTTILEDLSDSEATLWSGRARAVTSVVAHRVTTARPGMDPGFNAKTLEQWKALLPDDVLIEAGTGRVL